MYIAHTIRLTPNLAQSAYFRRACGVARFAYNWALAEWRRLYEAGAKLSVDGLVKQLNAVKHEEYPWILEVTKAAPQYAIHNVGAAFAKTAVTACGEVSAGVLRDVKLASLKQEAF